MTEIEAIGHYYNNTLPIFYFDGAWHTRRPAARSASSWANRSKCCGTTRHEY